MSEAIDCGPRKGPHRGRFRAASLCVALAFLALAASCSRLVKVSDQTIPKLITPLAEADFNGLAARLAPLTGVQSLRSSRVLIQFIDAESAERFRTADAVLVLQRPDKIRLIVQIPVTGTKIAEMTSQANRFRVAIYRDPYKRFLIGTNDADYSRWREKLGRESQSALLNARPFHFTDALLIQPLRLGEGGFVYSLEEALTEEPDQRKGAKKGARVLRSFYVISEIEALASEPGRARLRRRLWFDRTDQARFARQQIFDERGILTTEVQYSNYLKLSAESPELRPSVILVMRPHENYSARLTFLEEGTELNPEDLTERAFALENTQRLPETNLDQPEGTR